jgi:hypothetical protein
MENININMRNPNIAQILTTKKQQSQQQQQIERQNKLHLTEIKRGII